MKVTTLISQEEISNKVNELALIISNDYAEKELLVVGILKGSFVFMADLIRNLSIPCRCDFVKLSSYGKETVSSGEVKMDLDISSRVEGENVLVVEDIVDTGLTLSKLKEILASRQPASLRVCAFLDKSSRRKVPVEIDYRGFEIPDKFVVGYGLDCDEQFRYLPYVGIIEEDS
ncbi:TPA: hypoxanthine phosphoribosyltransferase [bacterium]|nr:hypoxanthine phosphoribosyltransferase [bacterium]